MRELYAYDESGQLLGRYLSNTSPGTEWTLDEELIWLDNQPVASVRIENSQLIVRSILSDHLNTPRALTMLHGGNQPVGTTVWKWALTAKNANSNNGFGTDPANVDPDGDGTLVRFDLRFPGQQHDPETALHYNYFRDYEPSTGRYVESDPIGLEGGIVSYAYSRSRSLTIWDPLGLFTVDASCDYCEFGVNNKPRVTRELESDCSALIFAVTNLALACCLIDRCKKDGVVKCNGEGCKDQAGGAYNTPTRVDGRCTNNPEIVYCLKGINPIAVDITRDGFHEFAHSCGWRHGMGMGIPKDPGFRFYDNRCPLDTPIH